MAGQTGHQDIARRYAHACFSLAREQNQIDQVSADLDAVQHMLSSSADLRKFIGNATLRRADQAKALAALGDKAKFGALTQKFLGTLALKRRLDILPGIIAAVQDEIARHKGEITAQVTTAQTLDAAQVNALAAALKKALGLTVKINQQQDTHIIGGLVIKVGSRLIDSSVRAKLDRLHRALKNSNTSKDKTKMREVA